MKKHLFLHIAICLFLHSVSYGQVQAQKETIYISYDKCKKRNKIGNKDRIRFIICSESFIYEASKNSKKKLSYDQIKDSLISVSQAKKKVKEYLERVRNEFEKQAKTKSERKISDYRKNTYIHYYNRYFDAIYVFQNQSKEEGTLYEVRWESFIE